MHLVFAATLSTFSLDSKRSSPSLLARQLRLRLVAGDESDVPRNLHNIVVSIHAIATFQALHDYLRPRVAGLLSSGSRLHGMLAALAGYTSASLEASANASRSLKPPASSVESNPDSTTTSTGGRRRSLRLSAKNAIAAGGTSSMDTESAGATINASGDGVPKSTPEVGPPSVDTAPSDTLVDSELQADFTDDDEIDADVFDDDEVDPDQSVSEKTVMLSVVEGLHHATKMWNPIDGRLP